MSELGRRVRQLRTSLHLTQEEVAKQVGVVTSYIAMIESGRTKNPSPEVLRALAKALEAPPEDLVIAAGYLPERPPSGEAKEQQYIHEDLVGLSDEEVQNVKAMVRVFVKEAKRQAAERRNREAEVEAKRKHSGG